MTSVKLVFEVLALGCFIIAATNLVAGDNRVRVVSAGLALFVASLVF